MANARCGKAIGREGVQHADRAVDGGRRNGRQRTHARLNCGRAFGGSGDRSVVDERLKEGYDAAFVVDAVGGMSQLAHRTAIERLSHAGAVPNTALALVAELFRNWKSPVADKAREIIKWHLAETQKIAAEVQKKAA